mmetsp:Transcript_23121/g.78117  ORF Transcript_23121/g.78117 Transcript_23121/m.78117 type:complete len:288 (-) Transcript_23121:1621-2484(-)
MPLYACTTAMSVSRRIKMRSIVKPPREHSLPRTFLPLCCGSTQARVRKSSDRRSMSGSAASMSRSSPHGMLFSRPSSAYVFVFVESASEQTETRGPRPAAYSPRQISSVLRTMNAWSSAPPPPFILDVNVVKTGVIDESVALRTMQSTVASCAMSSSPSSMACSMRSTSAYDRIVNSPLNFDSRATRSPPRSPRSEKFMAKRPSTLTLSKARWYSASTASAAGGCAPKFRRMFSSKDATTTMPEHATCRGILNSVCRIKVRFDGPPWTTMLMRSARGPPRAKSAKAC